MDRKELIENAEILIALKSETYGYIKKIGSTAPLIDFIVREKKITDSDVAPYVFEYPYLCKLALGKGGVVSEVMRIFEEYHKFASWFRNEIDSSLKSLKCQK